VSARAAEAPHAPRRGRGARLLGRFHVTGVFWYRFHGWGVRSVPDRLTPAVVVSFAFAFSHVLRGMAGAIGRNLEPVLGPGHARRRGRRTLRTFAWCLTERYERLFTERTFEVRVENPGPWQELSGRGCILLTAHLGLADFGSLLPVTEEGRHVHVVREREMDPEAQRWYEDLLRTRLGDLPYETHFASDDPSLGVQLLQALGRGEIVGLQGDRPRAGGRTLPVTLFGRPYTLPEGPVALARAAGVPILPVYTLREGRRRYTVVFDDPIEVPRGEGRAAGVAQAATAIAASLERAIRRAPHQWFCFAPLWD
jgi:KDO2-lipid IV(A) lauroyltransferase